MHYVFCCGKNYAHKVRFMTLADGVSYIKLHVPLFKVNNNNYLFISVHHWMKELWQDSIVELAKPHVHIYLDCPIEIIRERINKRGNVSEISRL